MDKKILVTGATGFAGSFLLEYLSAKGNRDLLFGTYLSETGLKNLDRVRDRLRLTKVDLLNEEETYNLLEKIKPDVVFHLAAMSSAANSFSSPSKTITNNIQSQVNILEGIRKLNLTECKILIISSSEVYGNVPQTELPINEDAGFNPTSPYAVSKLAQDFLGLQYFLTYKLKIIRARPFNHIGPRQSEGFVVSTFAKKIVEIEKGKRDNILNVGNLEAKRDFTDVRDMVKAYDLLIEKGATGDVYNLGSGVSYKIADILENLLSLSKAKIKVEIDKSLFRPLDNPELVCDADKFKKLTGWKPEIKIETTLKETLDYWRDII